MNIVLKDEIIISNCSSANPKLDLFMKEKYGPKFKYSDFAPMFKAELFDPKEWAQLFAEAGAKYGLMIIWRCNRSFITS